MARTNTKIGDIFSVKIDDNNKKYFQLVAFDLRQLNSDVIRVFKDVYPIKNNLNMSEIINGEVEFYVHCVTKFGLKMNLWEKVGNNANVGNISNILFRDTDDAGSMPGEQVKVSNKWYVWRINDKAASFVGMLEGENRYAEIGIIVNPYDVVERIKTSKFSFFYPGFE